jgi:hypothetical protein
MTSNPYQDLAKEFLDIWQKQIGSVMGDKQFIHAMLELLQQLQAKQTYAKPTTTANTAAASGSEHELLAELAFRVAMCEKRLAALESAPHARKKPAAKPQKTAKRSATTSTRNRATARNSKSRG